MSALDNFLGYMAGNQQDGRSQSIAPNLQDLFRVGIQNDYQYGDNNSNRSAITYLGDMPALSGSAQILLIGGIFAFVLIALIKK